MSGGAGTWLLTTEEAERYARLLIQHGAHRARVFPLANGTGLAVVELLAATRPYQLLRTLRTPADCVTILATPPVERPAPPRNPYRRGRCRHTTWEPV